MTYTPDSDHSIVAQAEVTAGTSSNRGRSWARLVIGVFMFLALVWFGGFALFLSNVNSFSEVEINDVSADGIAVLTGGFARLEPAVQLLKMERGERLLISGVNPKNSDGLLKSALQIDDQLFDCCVDIDLDAMDTIGNARGISHWATAKNYKTIVIVTNDYHMPRSIIEIKRALSGVEIIPFPVRNVPQGDETVSAKLDRYRVLTGEYVKYIATGIRGIFGRFGRSNGTVSASLSTGW